MTRALSLHVLDADTVNLRATRLVRPCTALQLHSYIRTVLGFHMPQMPSVPGHHAPFEYLVHSFFEPPSDAPSPDQTVGGVSRDCVVWANRGGGKTQLGAIATLLDMLFKPGIQIRILGGSFEQSSKMHRYLKSMVEREVFDDLIAGRCTGRFLELTNGSRVEVLSQSERSVRGQRVHKVRCDEVELFKPDVWDAAQLVTRSGWCGDTWVRGAIEALSTMHKPFGLMQRLVRESPLAGRRMFRWSALDTLQHCPTSRECETCPLWIDCQGRAKLPQARGFFEIDDAIQQRRRVGLHVWNAEMLCTEPDRTDCVYPEFDVKVHVVSAEAPLLATPTDCNPWASSAGDHCTVIGGIDFGYRAPTVILWAIHDRASDVVTIVDELVLREYTTEKVIDLARRRMSELELSPDWFGVDPAGHQRNEHTGASTIAMWKRAGFTIRTRSMNIAGGVAAVRSRLRRADGSIGLRIHSRCENLIDAMSKYRYPPAASGRMVVRESDEVSPLKDGPDHACDALRYMITNLDREGMGAGGRIY